MKLLEAQLKIKTTPNFPKGKKKKTALKHVWSSARYISTLKSQSDSLLFF